MAQPILTPARSSAPSPIAYLDDGGRVPGLEHPGYRELVDGTPRARGVATPRHAEAARRALGRWARLRLAWRGE